MGKLDGMVCLVTGAAQGMGRGHVLRMASEGARVAVNDVADDDRLRGVVAEMGTHDELVAHEGHYASLYRAWAVHQATPDVA